MKSEKTSVKNQSIAILDFGSQYTQLIARRVRAMSVYCEIFPWDVPPESVMPIEPSGFILSGGPNSVYEKDSPFIPDYVLESNLPILGICYGMQALTHALGGSVAASQAREYGSATLKTIEANPLIPAGEQVVWMSHADRIETPPAGFLSLAKTENAPIAAIGDQKTKRYGVQFHPEVSHTPGGDRILRGFVTDVCGCEPSWTPESIINATVARIRDQVADEQVLAAVSGGVDSSVAAALVHKAVGDQLVAIFVDTGLLRAGESIQVVSTFQDALGVEMTVVDAEQDFMTALQGVTEPEQKRQIIGERFIRIFEAHAQDLGSPKYLVQGTIYPDVVESSAPERAQVDRIKTHHNVGGLPPDMDFDLVEPLRFLFKDEVRAVGTALGLPDQIVWRQPFPGPGLAVRCLGEVTPQRLQRLREADSILLDELEAAELLIMQEKSGQVLGSAQAFTVLLPVRSVGVMGDQRTYQEVIAIRAVTTDDFMTADWARIPQELLGQIANRIVNEVPGINRVVYDLTTKPPATIEWE